MKKRKSTFAPLLSWQPIPCQPSRSKLGVGLGAIALLIGIGREGAVAQFDDSCFLMDENGRVYDLEAICEVDSSEPPVPPSTLDEVPAEPLPTDTNSTLQITLRWETIDDLDLSIVDPAGNNLSVFEPTTETGGTFEAEANELCSDATDTPVESAAWEGEQTPIGQYTITVDLFFYCQDTPVPIPFIVDVQTGAGVQRFEGVVSESNTTETFSFELSQSQLSQPELSQNADQP